jgi:hypothetical protein
LTPLPLKPRIGCGINELGVVNTCGAYTLINAYWLLNQQVIGNQSNAVAWKFTRR